MDKSLQAQNRRVALVLAAIAAAFFVGVVLRHSVFQ